MSKKSHLKAELIAESESAKRGYRKNSGDGNDAVFTGGGE
jgi:hypothetical protein